MAGMLAFISAFPRIHNTGLCRLLLLFDRQLFFHSLMLLPLAAYNRPARVWLSPAPVCFRPIFVCNSPTAVC
jgi:hypothetical protein